MKITVSSTIQRDTYLAEIDKLGDAARWAIVGDPIRAKEYERAEQHALAFKAVDFSGPPPSSVKAWADAKGWTPLKAAQDILAAADRWYLAMDTIRTLRLKAKEDIRNATSIQQIETITQTFKSALNTITSAAKIVVEELL